MALTACGGDQPAICDDVDTLQSSVDNLKDVQISENGLNALSADLSQIQRDVQQLTADAKAEFGDEASKVKSTVTSLETSVASAKANPSASTLSSGRDRGPRRREQCVGVCRTRFPAPAECRTVRDVPTKRAYRRLHLAAWRRG